MLKIEKGVPLPTRPAKRNTRWPWRDMEVGDSVLVENTEADPQLIYAARNSAHAYAANSTFKFRTSQIGKSQMRIWRVE